MPKQDVAVEIYYDSAWHDAVAAEEVLAMQGPIVIKRGNSDETDGFRACSITAVLDNSSDKYRTSNPESPLYGKAGLNTPIRVSVGGTVRAVAEASSWTTEQTLDFRVSPPRGMSMSAVEAGGLLQRLGQWTEPLRSPMYRKIISLSTLAAYWPGEDGSEATAMSSAYTGATSAQVSDVTFAGSDGPGGSSKLPTFGPDGDLSGVIPAGISTSGWQWQWVTNLAGADGTEREAMATLTSNGYWWVFKASSTSYRISVRDASGSEIYTQSSTTGGADPGENIVFRIRATLSAGTWTVETGWYEENAPFLLGFTGTFSGTAGAPVRWHAFANTVNENGYVGHVLFTSDASESLQTPEMLSSINGWASETVGDRFSRIMDELGLSYTVVGDASLSTPMGPQSDAALPEQLREIVATDDAMLFDSADDIALTLLLRGGRYNKDPALELIPTDFADLPAELTDDLGVHNVVVVSQRGGSDVTARDDSGPMGTQPPPDGVGEYKQEINVNVDETTAQYRLPQEANWWLRRGTVNLPRFPEVTIDLGASPHLITDVEAVDVGSVITITGLREYTIRLYVLGWTETIGTHTRSVTFTCAPDQQFQVGEYDATTDRYDLRTCTMSSSAAAGVTSLSLAITDDERWSTTSTPYDLLISGELVTVTSMGARGGSAGAYTQTATVTRAVNGISKTLAAGDAVHVATPGRWAL